VNLWYFCKKDKKKERGEEKKESMLGWWEGNRDQGESGGSWLSELIVSLQNQERGKRREVERYVRILLRDWEGEGKRERVGLVGRDSVNSRHPGCKRKIKMERKRKTVRREGEEGKREEERGEESIFLFFICSY
jgi:hypothetical protein